MPEASSLSPSRFRRLALPYVDAPGVSRIRCTFQRSSLSWTTRRLVTERLQHQPQNPSRKERRASYVLPSIFTSGPFCQRTLIAQPYAQRTGLVKKKWKKIEHTQPSRRLRSFEICTIHSQYRLHKVIDYKGTWFKTRQRSKWVESSIAR